METIFPLNLQVQKLTDYVATRVLFILSCNDDRRQCVEEYVTAESQGEVKFETECLQYTQSSHIQFAHFLAAHVLREEDRREHSNWVNHVETKLLSRLQKLLSRLQERLSRYMHPELDTELDTLELGEVYFLEDVVCSLDRWITTQKDHAQVLQRALAETTTGADIEDLDAL